LEDKEFFEKMDEKKLREGEEERDMEEKYQQLKRDYANLKLKVHDMETEIHKSGRKEGMYRSKLAELELNYDESLHSVSSFLIYSSLTGSTSIRPRFTSKMRKSQG
jgi:hypothetical protein